MSDPKDPRVTSTGGHDPEAGPSAAPGPINPATGQHESYWILSEEERAKGFVRPVRRTYVHTGKKPKGPMRPHTPEEKASYDPDGSEGFVSVEQVSPTVERFWTDKELKPKCGTATTMGTALAETYARQPSFYGSTFCVGCKAHFSVEEFEWADAPGQVVGS